MSEDFRYGPVTRQVHGVFKGGGAKGIVYGAALHELRARGIWFRSVAGSSAGAITATMIAVGHDPQTMATQIDDALGSLKKNVVQWLHPSGERALYRTDQLERWIESQLRYFLPVPDDSPPVTFRQLLELGPGIELNVVAMDLATKQPIVFNSTTAPNCSVAASVVASSAIPVAMRARRFIVRVGDIARVHRVVDGGAWANYPAFVYRDPSFRSCHGLTQMADDDLVVGFVIEGQPATWQQGQPWPPSVSPPAQLDDVTDTSPAPQRFDLGSARRLGFLGALLSWAALRLTLGIGLTILLAAAVIRWWQGQLDGWTIGFGDEWPPILAGPAVIVAYAGVSLTIAVLGGLLFAQLRIVPEAVEVGLPSMFALMSVGPGVPAWVGHHPSDIVVRLSAPPGIGTTDFKPPEHLKYLALVIAGHQANSAMDSRFPDHVRAPLPSAETLLRKDSPWSDPMLQSFMPSEPASLEIDGAVTFVVGFYALLAFSMLFLPGYQGVLAMLIVGAPFSAWLVRRLVNGRRINQSLHGDSDELPRRQTWAGRLVGAVLLVAVAIVLAQTYDYSKGRDGWWDEPTAAMVLVVIGMCMIGGVSSILSVVSRIGANSARTRYLKEIGEAS